jgi:polyphosphate kinase
LLGDSDRAHDGDAPMGTLTTQWIPDARIDVRPILRRVHSTEIEAFLDSRFKAEILPLLTPIVLDRGHPLPPLRPGTWGLAVRFQSSTPRRYGVVLVHPALPRLIEAPNRDRVPLEHIVASHVTVLFGRSSIETCWTFEVAPHGSPVTGALQDVKEFLSGALQKAHRHQKGFARWSSAG